jgi:hypothetical protein
VATARGRAENLARFLYALTAVADENGSYLGQVRADFTTIICRLSTTKNAENYHCNSSLPSLYCAHQLEDMVMRISKLPNRGALDRLLVIVQGFAGILDGLVMIGTLGFYGSCFELNVSRYRAWRMVKNSH